MIESISKNISIPKVNKDRLNGKEYGLIKSVFIKLYGSLSNYNIPWKNLEIEDITINENYFDFRKNVYVLVDSFETPIYKCSKKDFNNLFNPLFSYDVDIYVFEESITRCIVYTGLFDKKTYKLKITLLG